MISSGSSERLDDEFRLHSSLPVCFFAGFVESAVEVAGFDEEEEEEEEDDEEEVDVLGKVGINSDYSILTSQELINFIVT